MNDDVASCERPAANFVRPFSNSRPLVSPKVQRELNSNSLFPQLSANAASWSPLGPRPTTPQTAPCPAAAENVNRESALKLLDGMLKN